MTTKTLETTLSQIRSNHFGSSPLTDLSEQAIKQTVILPLLNRVGWDQEDPSVVSPEHETGHGPVDYALRANGVSRVFVEAKAGSVELSEHHEDQVQRYCCADSPGKCHTERPDLAILTNGREWWLYVLMAKNGKMGRFLELDIIDSADKVTNDFSKFLAYENIPLHSAVLREARSAHRDRLDKRKAFERMTEAWDELSNDSPHLAAFLKSITPSPPDDEVVRDFLVSVDRPLVNKISEALPSTKPASFSFPTKRKRDTYPVVGAKGWNNLLLSICAVVQKLHPDNFHEDILSVADWFSESKDPTFSIPVGDTGLYVKWEGSREVRKVCYEIVQKFGYPRDAFIIKDKHDNTL